MSRIAMSLVAVLIFAAATSASGRKSDLAIATSQRGTSLGLNLADSLADPWIATSADNKIKDCSQAKTCATRCSCQYDNCTAGCDNIDDLIKKSNCVNGCIAANQSCNDKCN